MDDLRRDAARNRARIIEVAREAARRGESLAFNSVARAAEVGVGTVYRHFASIDELEEVIVWDRFDELESVFQEDGPRCFERVLTAHVLLLSSDALFEKVMARPVPVLPETAEKRNALVDRLGEVLSNMQAHNGLRADIDAGGVLLLACGIAHAIRSGAYSAESSEARAFLSIALKGLRMGE